MQRLEGGNVADVHRVAETVRKPWTKATPAVHALLDHYAAAGLNAAPRQLGRDAKGRQTLEYIAGASAHTGDPLGDSDLHRVGELIRTLHDAASTFTAPENAQWTVEIAPDAKDLICHHDLAPWNLIRAEDRWVFIDWDGAGPGSRLWDLAYAAQTFIPLDGSGDPESDGRRLAVLADAYELDASQRRALPALIERHTRGMYDLLADGARNGRQPWARLYSEGHGEFWLAAADYVAANLLVLVEAIRAET